MVKPMGQIVTNKRCETAAGPCSQTGRSLKKNAAWPIYRPCFPERPSTAQDGMSLLCSVPPATGCLSLTLVALGERFLVKLQHPHFVEPGLPQSTHSAVADLLEGAQAGHTWLQSCWESGLSCLP